MGCVIFVKKQDMKVLSIFFGLFLLVSCGMKVPFTNEIRDEFGLETDKELRKVQFFTSETIILEKNKSTDNQSATEDGALVSSSRNTEERLIIPINTKCVFDGYGPNKELMIRFELGTGKALLFTTRANQPSGKYYLVADFSISKGGKLTYGNETYYITSTGSSAYLLVVLKKLQKTRKKDRIVKGMKV